MACLVVVPRRARWFVDLRCMRANEGDCQAERASGERRLHPALSNKMHSPLARSRMHQSCIQLSTTESWVERPLAQCRRRPRQHPKLFFLFFRRASLCAASTATHQIQTISLVSPLLLWWVGGCDTRSHVALQLVLLYEKLLCVRRTNFLFLNLFFDVFSSPNMNFQFKNANYWPILQLKKWMSKVVFSNCVIVAKFVKCLNPKTRIFEFYTSVFNLKVKVLF